MSTLSSDRCCRTYNTSTKKLIAKSYKSHLNLNEQTKTKPKANIKDKDAMPDDGTKPTKEPEPEKLPHKEKEIRLYHDETFKGFFRRLTWSTDGKF